MSLSLGLQPSSPPVESVETVPGDVEEFAAHPGGSGIEIVIIRDDPQYIWWILDDFDGITSYNHQSTRVLNTAQIVCLFFCWGKNENL